MSDVVESGPKNPWPMRGVGTAALVALSVGGYLLNHEHGSGATSPTASHATPHPVSSEHSTSPAMHAEKPLRPVYFSYSQRKDAVRFTRHGAQVISLVGHGADTHLKIREVGVSFSDLHCSPQHKLLGTLAVIYHLYKFEHTAKNVELPQNSLSMDCLLDGKLSVVHSGNLSVVGEKVQYPYTTQDWTPTP